VCCTIKWNPVEDVKNAINDVADAGSDIVSDTWETTKETATDIADAGSDLIQSGSDAVKNTYDMSVNIGDNLLRGDFQGLVDDFKHDIGALGTDVANMTRAQLNIIGGVVAMPFDVIGLHEVGDFSRNVMGGIGNNLALIIEGATQGDWSKFRDGFIGSLTTVMYVAAGVIGVLIGNPILAAAAIIALDGQHNRGMLTKHVVETLGKLETALIHTHYLQEYSEEITFVLIAASSLYAGYVGSGFIMSQISDLAILKSTIETYSIVNGAYGIYDSFQQYEEYRAYYEQKLNEYYAWVEQLNQAYAQSKQQWFEMYADLKKQEVCYESMAGGYLYNAGAGSDEYSVSSIHEQGAYMLVMDTKRDMFLDKTLFYNSDVDYVNLNLEYVKEPINKWM